jgi:hypothetical protein
MKWNVIASSNNLPWLQKSMPGTRPSTQTVSPCTVLCVVSLVRSSDFITWLPATKLPYLGISLNSKIQRNTKRWSLHWTHHMRIFTGNELNILIYTHTHTHRDGVTFFISFWSATLMNILHLRKYIRTRQWNVQSAAPKYWICPSMNASRISTSKDLVEVILIYKFTGSTYQRKSSKHTSLEKTGHTQENHC